MPEILSPELKLAIKLPNDEGPSSSWNGWRVWAIDIHDEPDNGSILVKRISVHVEPFDARPMAVAQVFDFHISTTGDRASDRFVAFAAACGIRQKIENTRELEGRFFATRNDGKRAVDFGPLVHALGKRS